MRGKTALASNEFVSHTYMQPTFAVLYGHCRHSLKASLTRKPFIVTLGGIARQSCIQDLCLSHTTLITLAKGCKSHTWQIYCHTINQSNICVQKTAPSCRKPEILSLCSFHKTDSSRTGKNA